MPIKNEAQRLRIYIGDQSRHKGSPLYQWIVEKAKKRKMAGATVFRGHMGFGASSCIHTDKILRLSEDLPVVVEIVDRPERIEALLLELDAVLTKGMITLETVQVRAYRDGTTP
ncbi:DUF190 domain-containing protein [Desulfoluna sp.]|uniref:DUF190 domain-containing protein n=1 Tax=Desulfoluna sp. TaxID=2045199 RepID=UPI00260AF31D|nr:DUF190 domain-containing protein [Desulfoluna sp.]